MFAYYQLHFAASGKGPGSWIKLINWLKTWSQNLPPWIFLFFRHLLEKNKHANDNVNVPFNFLLIRVLLSTSVSVHLSNKWHTFECFVQNKQPPCISITHCYHGTDTCLCPSSYLLHVRAEGATPQPPLHTLPRNLKCHTVSFLLTS